MDTVIYEKYYRPMKGNPERVFVSLYDTDEEAVKALEKIASLWAPFDGIHYKSADRELDFGLYALAIMPLADYLKLGLSYQENMRIIMEMLIREGY